MHKKIFVSAIAVFIFYNINCIDSDLPKKVAQLTVEHPFAFFDLQISQQDLNFLQSLPIGVSDQFKKHETIALNHYGNLDGYQGEIFEYLISLGCDQDRAFKAAEIMYNIVHDILNLLDQPEAWVAIRSFTSNHSYDEARWHIDESLHTTDCGYSYKVIVALKGASTLLCNPSATVRAEFFKTRSTASQSRNNAAQSVRTRLANLLSNSIVLSAKKGQAAVFIMGSEKFGAIHSEPIINEPRIFMSIVPGNHDQITELYDKWHTLIANRFR